MTVLTAGPATGKKIIYSRTYPYGAPKVTIRGGATRIPQVKNAMRDAGFRWNGTEHGWVGYGYDDMLTSLFNTFRALGATVEAKVYND